jgi:hypothetical protein
MKRGLMMDLFISVAVDIYKHTVNSSVPWGNRFDSECNARGDPLPSVRWLLDGKEVLYTLMSASRTNIGKIEYKGSLCPFVGWK